MRVEPHFVVYKPCHMIYGGLTQVEGKTMRNRLLISFDGHLTVVEQSTNDLCVALVVLRNANPDRTVVLVKVLAD